MIAVTVNLSSTPALIIGGIGTLAILSCLVRYTYRRACEVYTCRKVQDEENRREQVRETERAAQALLEGAPVHPFVVDIDGDPICPKCGIAFYTRSALALEKKERRFTLEDNAGWLCTCPQLFCEYFYVMRPKATVITSEYEKDALTVAKEILNTNWNGVKTPVGERVDPDDLEHGKWYHVWDVKDGRPQTKYMGTFRCDLDGSARLIPNFEYVTRQTDDREITFYWGTISNNWSPDDDPHTVDSYMFVEADIDYPEES